MNSCIKKDIVNRQGDAGVRKERSLEKAISPRQQQSCNDRPVTAQAYLVTLPLSSDEAVVPAITYSNESWVTVTRLPFGFTIQCFKISSVDISLTAPTLNQCFSDIQRRAALCFVSLCNCLHCPSFPWQLLVFFSQVRQWHAQLSPRLTLR